jgi:hypothetical protein
MANEMPIEVVRISQLPEGSYGAGFWVVIDTGDAVLKLKLDNIVPAATGSTAGKVKLSDATDLDSSTVAATAKAVKTVAAAVASAVSAIASKYTKPSNGIPKSDLSSSVQSSLEKADTALQTHQDISGKANLSVICDDYSSSSTYEYGDPCIHDGILYICNVPGGITVPEEWTAEHWDETDIETQFGDVETALDEVNDILEDLNGTPGMTDLGVKTESDLTSGDTLTIGTGNSTTTLVLTSISDLRIVSNVGAPNFAVEIDNSGNSHDVEVVVVESDDMTALKNSVAGGTTIAANTTVQLTAVGGCWTMAEFERGSGSGV